MFITIILFLIFIACLYVVKQRRILKDLPESPSNFFTGHYFYLNSTTNILNAFTKFVEYAPITKIRMGLTFIGILTTDYHFVDFLLTNNKVELKKSHNYEFLKPWLGTGLLTAHGEEWKKARKLLTSAFHFEILKDFVEVFETAGNTLIKNLAKNINDDVDLYPFLTLYTLDVICETAMGTKINAQKGKNVDYVNSVKDMCKIVTRRCLEFMKVADFTFFLTEDYWLQKKSLKKLQTFTVAIINMKKTEIDHKDLNGKKKMALLDLLITSSQNDNCLSYEEIRQQVDTFMFAGHDTTASGICFTLYCLADHQDIQEKVFEEQQELFNNDKNPTVRYEDLQNMKYLELVIKESLRLYPPVPVIGRRVNEDTKYGNFTIPKDTNIAIFIHGIHRNPQFFPNPEKFDPDRFCGLRTFPPYTYLPFSTGPRNCIGQKFAMLEMKSTISKIIRHFKLIATSPRHELKLAAETVLKSVNGVKVKLKPRIY